jgi:uncharacterized SAM-binding protein YcdF (DUF218 family)
VSPRLIANALLVPPISLLLVALLGFLLRRRYRRRWVPRALTWIGLLGLLALAMPVVGGSLLITLERDLPLTPPPDALPQAIVILGGDLAHGGTDTLSLHLGPASLERVRAGAALARRTGLPVLVSAGSLLKGEGPLAGVMADTLAQDFQVPVRWTEAASADTWENAHLSAAILREHGIRSIYVVTHAWHMRRAVLAFADTGITVTAAPPWLDRLRSPLWVEFVPDVGGWYTSYIALHEWIGCAYYTLR